ncbi:hypothetical protein TNCV_3162241 [Trichonephila clavipes]|nr:hypothetical protein TNCV_3162241 [Trichonephila clavipes]
MLNRKSIRLQNREFKDYIRDIERLNRVPITASPASQPKRKSAKRQPASPSKQTPSKKQANGAKAPTDIHGVCSVISKALSL